MKEQETDLVGKAKASLKAGRRDIAQSFVVELERLRPQLGEKERALVAATAALERAKSIKKEFMAEKDKKIQEAQRALSAKRQADWNDKVANTLDKFQVTGVDATHDEMIRRIEQQTATSEAKLQMALENKHVGNAQIEEDAKKIQAEETLRQFELEMVSPPTPPLRPRPRRRARRRSGPKSARRPEMAQEVPKWWPVWANEFREKYLGGTIIEFIVHGAIHDLQRSAGSKGERHYVSLRDFLEEQLSGSSTRSSPTTSRAGSRRAIPRPCRTSSESRPASTRPRARTTPRPVSLATQGALSTSWSATFAPASTRAVGRSRSASRRSSSTPAWSAPPAIRRTCRPRSRRRSSRSCAGRTIRPSSAPRSR